ncbi:MAG: sensor domain-containing diguanylate cyclase [Acidimicrobiia bacterium]|nr:sensor domain-containing diguanylate cyclase [Acidimicrobiia bacterium]
MEGRDFRLDDLPTGAILVRGGLVVAANEIAAGVLGVASTEALVGSGIDARIDPDDRAAVRAALGAGAPTTINVRRVAPPGRRTIELTMAPASHDNAPADNAPTDGAPGDGADDSRVLVLVRDVTDAVRTALALDTLADGTCTLTSEALVDWASPDGARLLEADAVTTQALLERLHPEDLPVVLDAVARSRVEPGRRECFRLRWSQESDAGEWVDEDIVIFGGADNPDLRASFIQRRRPEKADVTPATQRELTGLQSLAEVAPVGIVVAGPSGRTVYCNLLAEKALGPLAAVLGETEWIDAARSEHRGALRRIAEAALNDGVTGSTVAAFDQPDGTARWLRVNIAPRSTGDGIGSGWIATIEDVSETIEARSQADRLAHLLDAGSDFVIITRPDGLIVYANDAARHQLGLATAEEGCTATLRSVLTDASRERFDAETLPEMLATGTWSGEMTLVLADKSEVPVSMLGLTRLTEGGQVETIAFTARDIVAIKAAEARMRHLASHDALTGLPNRMLLADRLEQALHRHRRHGSGVALMFCDLDGFKGVNDEHGHETGDALLAAVARRMRETVRETDTVARLGGDEFVVLCEGWVAEADLERIAGRIVDAVGRPITVGQHRLEVGVSIGVAVAGRGSDSYDALMALADVAMYRAKEGGRGRYEMASATPPQ